MAVNPFNIAAAKIAVFLALLSLVPLKMLIAAEEPPNLADAKKEGKVVLYVSAQLPLAQTISRAFEKKYPFLKVEITRTSGENLINRIKTEKLAGKISFDVVYGATVPLMPTLGVVKPYLSAEAKAYPAKFRDPKDFWAGVSANYYVIGYNTKLVATNEAPRDWKDLLHARWKGRFAMDPEEYSWFGAMETYLGEEEGKKLMTGLARQDIQWRKNHTTLSQFLAAGEYPAALVYAHSIEDMKGKGAPIEWVRTAAPIVLDIQAVALSAQPPHPNAGKLFMDFLLSSEAQTIIYQDRKIPIRPGVVPESSALHPTGLELFPSPPKVVTNLNHYASKFEQIFGPRR